VKCQECHKDATIHVSHIENGQTVEIHLCEDCALLRGVVTQLEIEEDSEQQVEESSSSLCCQECGWEYAEYQKSGVLGCADCYEYFSGHLDSILQNIHGTLQHKGKWPYHLNRKDFDEAPTIFELQRRLKDAVTSQQFEAAAVLKRQIEQLQSHIRE